MKKQTTQNWAVSLQLLGIVFVLLFNTAFVCGGNESNLVTDLPASTTNSETLTEVIVKEIITAKVIRTNKDFETEITFESVRIGKTRTANKADENQGIPAGETVYPVRVKYTVVLQTSTGPQTTNHHYDWDFFKDSFGEWASLGKGPVR